MTRRVNLVALVDQDSAHCADYVTGVHLRFPDTVVMTAIPLPEVGGSAEVGAYCEEVRRLFESRQARLLLVCRAADFSTNIDNAAWLADPDGQTRDANCQFTAVHFCQKDADRDTCEPHVTLVRGRESLAQFVMKLPQ
jgi:hypothetical protein